VVNRPSGEEDPDDGPMVADADTRERRGTADAADGDGDPSDA